MGKASLLREVARRSRDERSSRPQAAPPQGLCPIRGLAPPKAVTEGFPRPQAGVFPELLHLGIVHEAV